jgi:hypothetical protein
MEGLFLLLFIWGVVLAVWTAIWILQPVARKAKAGKHSRQFTLADFLALFLVFQLWMALVHGLFHDGTGEARGLLDVCGWIVLGLPWWVCVQMLSRAGVRTAWRRGVFLAIVLPITVAGTFAIVAYTVTLPIVLFETLRHQARFDWLLLMLGAGVFLFGIFHATGRVSRWVAAGAEAEVERADKAEENEDLTQTAG